MRKKGKFTSSDDFNKKRKKRQKPLSIIQQIDKTDDEITSVRIAKPQFHKSSKKETTKDDTKKKRIKKTEAQKRRERLEKRYNNQLNRINRLIEQEMSKGFMQTDDILPLLSGNIDENIIEQLSQIHITDIRNAGLYIDEETGQPLPYNKWKYLQNKPQRLEQNYNNQLNRINRLIEKEMSKGFIQTDDIIPLLTGNIDENIVEELTQIHLADIRKAGVYVDEETGESLPYNKWKYLQEKRKKKEKDNSIDSSNLEETIEDKSELLGINELDELSNKRLADSGFEHTNGDTPFDEPYDDFASHIVSEFKSYLDKFPAQLNYPLKYFIDKMVSIVGETAVAQSLQRIPETLWDVFERCGFDYEETVREFTQLIIDWLPDVQGYQAKDFVDEDYLKEQIEMINTGYALQYKPHGR